MTTLDELLDARALEAGRWSFELARSLQGAFGGTFGGVQAALAVRAARGLAPERTPTAADCRFVRGLPAGPATAVATVVRAGRTVTVANVDVEDGDGRLAARALVSLADPEALHERTAADLFRPSANEAERRPWRAPAGVEVPIVAVLSPTVRMAGDHAISTELRPPWSVDAATAAEAACLAADLCVGPPVASACAGDWVPHPNPDLSLRFTGEAGDGPLVGTGRLVGLQAGVATVTVAVHAGQAVVAVGLATSLLLPPAP